MVERHISVEVISSNLMKKDNVIGKKVRRKVKMAYSYNSNSLSEMAPDLRSHFDNCFDKYCIIEFC